MLTRAKSTYTWDAENRLVSASNLTTSVVCNFVYDHQSRRISKTVLNSSLITQYSSFIYDGWNLIGEVIDDQTTANTNIYVWGLDLSGTLQGAGGVGGLLSQTVIKPSLVKRYFPLADANGNCVSFIDEAGNVQAHYTFDAFGNTVSQSGAMAADFSFRFSSKYMDDETGLYYYGYRYYSPALGRWVNRDPIGERGGLHLYCIGSNQLTQLYDVLGLSTRAGVPKFIKPSDGFINLMFQVRDVDECCQINVIQLFAKVGDDETYAGKDDALEFDAGGTGDKGYFYFANQEELTYQRDYYDNAFKVYDFDPSITYIFSDNPGIGGSWVSETLISFLIPVEICEKNGKKSICLLGLQKYSKNGRNYNYNLVASAAENSLIDQYLKVSLSSGDSGFSKGDFK